MVTRLVIGALLTTCFLTHPAELATIIDTGHGYNFSTTKKQDECSLECARQISNAIEDSANNLRLSVLNIVASINENWVSPEQIEPYTLDQENYPHCPAEKLCFLALRRYNGLLDILTKKARPSQHEFDKASYYCTPDPEACYEIFKRDR